MKKYFIILAVAALAASAACTKVEVIDNTPGQKISFAVANYVPQTRANVSLIGETTSFSSKAFLHAVGVDGVQNFFGENGETITANNAPNPSEWLPSHDYYWPKSKDSYINFVSWYDNGAADAAKAVVTETSITWTNRTIGTADNIMWADEAWHFNANVEKNAEGDNGYWFNSVTEGVPTLFHHALAKLCVKAKAVKVQGGTNAANLTTWDVTLESINITNTYNAGTLALSNTEPSGTTPATQSYTGAAWTPTGTASGISMGNSQTLTTELVDVLEEQSVLPQTLGENAKLSFTLHIITKYNGTKYSEEKIPVEVALNTLKGTADDAAAITEWAMNTKYTYNIIVDPETSIVKFDPAVVDWVVVEYAPTYTVPSGQI